MNESVEGHYEKPKKEMGFKTLFVLLTYLQIVQMNVYCITIFNITNLPGNKYAYGILLGVAEVISYPIAGFLLKYYSDVRNF